LRSICALALVLLTGCASTSGIAPDFFSGQAEFAADRERETILISSLDYESACAHVTEVLMDLDCGLQEINSQLGLISAHASSRWVPVARMAEPTRIWHSCAGHRITVRIKGRSAGDIAIRASFYPANAAADETFRALLRKSISLEAVEEESHE
jgi:hypothetical protein